MKSKFLIMNCCVIFSYAANPEHVSSFPYISGDTFRAFSYHILDNAQTFEPNKVKMGDVIFVEIDYLKSFFAEFHLRIAVPYVLLTHNGDTHIPGEFEPYLNDPKLAAWFGQNVEMQHPKLHSLPIGLANKYYEHGRTALYDTFRACCKDRKRTKLLYMNFNKSTYPSERNLVYEMFKTKSFCTLRSNLAQDQYLKDLLHHKFALSPRGNGLDCHRTWEALLMGAYPVVRTSTLDPLYEGLPVVIIHDWAEVTEGFLNQKYEEMKHKTYNLNKLFAPYWFNEIRKAQQEIRAHEIGVIST